MAESHDKVIESDSRSESERQFDAALAASPEQMDELLVKAFETFGSEIRDVEKRIDEIGAKRARLWFRTSV
jgi:hypothetical protein